MPKISRNSAEIQGVGGTPPLEPLGPSGPENPDHFSYMSTIILKDVYRFAYYLVRPRGPQKGGIKMTPKRGNFGTPYPTPYPLLT